jgi:NADPH:quinone reductase-like Zn-dependent oxidoreductase
MRAVRIHAFGGTDRLTLEDVPVPQPGPGEVRIKVGAVAVNPIDWRIRSGLVPQFEGQLPFTLGCEGVGTITALGDGVEGHPIGERVWGFVDPLRAGGWYAEEVVVPASTISIAPPKLDDTQAASMPIGVLTARQAFQRADFRAGERVLVLGGASCAGAQAIQVARSLVGWVYATASARDQEFLREIGANQPLDPATADLAEEAKDVDVVFDALGGAAADAAYACLREGGRFVSVVKPPDEAKLAKRKATGFFHRGLPDALQLIQTTSEAEFAILRPAVAEIFRLPDVVRAHAMSETGQVRGKLILIP